jgi:DNA-binding NarL/FixJ family response regulator
MGIVSQHSQGKDSLQNPQKKGDPIRMSSPKAPSAGKYRTVTPIQVLVVDDYEPFRRFVRSTLKQRPDLQVIGEASDGVEAVQKAVELHPDLIVLDIGLPRLNGIEAARQIRELCPECKILFLSQESSADVVQETLSLGAPGYVVKAYAGSELLPAVDAVCQGRQFVGRGISGHDRDKTTDPQVRDPLFGGSSSLAPSNGAHGRGHTAEFYSDDSSFVVGFAHFIETAINAGNAVIAVVTKPHLNSLYQTLQARGLNLGAAIERQRFIGLDVTDILSTFMVNHLPDPDRFFKVVGDLIASPTAAGGHSRVAICGECGSTLWAQGNADGAIQVEQLCNQLSKRYGMNVLCGFSLSSFYREEDKETFQRICANT